MNIPIRKIKYWGLGVLSGLMLFATLWMTLTAVYSAPAAASTIGFDSTTYTVAEDNSTIPITVTLDMSTIETITATYMITTGSATAGVDFTGVQTDVITFTTGTSETTFTVDIVNDNFYEGDETISLTLNSVSTTSVTILNDTAVLTITDSTDLPTLTFQESGYALNEGDALPDVVAHIDMTATMGITYTYRFLTGMASADDLSSDVISYTGVIMAGEQTITLTQPITAAIDNLYEGGTTETFDLELKITAPFTRSAESVGCDHNRYNSHTGSAI